MMLPQSLLDTSVVFDQVSQYMNNAVLAALSDNRLAYIIAFNLLFTSFQLTSFQNASMNFALSFL